MKTLNFPLPNSFHNPLNQAKSGLLAKELFLPLSSPQLWLEKNLITSCLKTNPVKGKGKTLEERKT